MRLRKGMYKPIELEKVCLQVTDGTHYTPNYVVAGFPFISAKDVNEFCVSFDVNKFVSTEEHEAFTRRCNPEPHDVLLSKVGTIGRAAVVPDKAPVFDLFVSVCLIKPRRDIISPDYLCAVLNSSFARAQFLRALKGIGVPDLHLEDIKRTLIPLPHPSIQERLTTALKAAFSTRCQKLCEADVLFTTIGDFVLDALGLTLPPPDGRIIYTARRGDARQRVDVDYHSPRFRTLRQKIEKGKYAVLSIGELFNPIVSGFAAGGDAQTDDVEIGVPHIRPLNITNDAELTFEGTKMVPRERLDPSDYLTKGEVLFNNTNSTAWVGKTVVFDSDRPCACSNHITRMTLRDRRHSPHYFAALFNAFRGIGYFGLLATNFNNQAGINVDTLKNVRIPVPKPDIQREIAKEVARRREKARHLRRDAELLWNEAKRRFEEELLGPESSFGVDKTDGKKGGRRK